MIGRYFPLTRFPVPDLAGSGQILPDMIDTTLPAALISGWEKIGERLDHFIFALEKYINGRQNGSNGESSSPRL